MKLSIIRALVVCIGALLCGGAFADGAALFGSADYVSKTSETVQLTAKERDRMTFLRADSSVRSAAAVSLNFAALESGVITVTMPDGKEVQFVGKKTNDATLSHWRGRSSTGSARFTFSTAGGKQDVVGVIVESGRTFRLSSLSDSRQVLMEVVVRPMSEPEMPSRPAPKASDLQKTPTVQSSSAFGAGVPTIRILTVFSDSAATWLGGSLATHAGFEIDDLNTAFANSGVNLAVVSAGVLRVAGYNAGVVDAAGLAAQDINVLVARDVADADVVIVVVKSIDNATGYALQIYADAATAFAAVQATELPDYTYQHEVGHLIGARHAYSGTTNDDSTGYPYAYGHGHWVRQAWVGYPTVCYHTIMAYPSLSGPACGGPLYDERALFFSNPSVSWRTYPTGTTTANNAQVLNNLGPSVTGFRATKLGVPFLMGLSAVLTILY